MQPLVLISTGLLVLASREDLRGENILERSLCLSAGHRFSGEGDTTVILELLSGSKNVHEHPVVPTLHERVSEDPPVLALGRFLSEGNINDMVVEVVDNTGYVGLKGRLARSGGIARQKGPALLEDETTSIIEDLSSDFFEA